MSRARRRRPEATAPDPRPEDPHAAERLRVRGHVMGLRDLLRRSGPPADARQGRRVPRLSEPGRDRIAWTVARLGELDDWTDRFVRSVALDTSDVGSILERCEGNLDVLLVSADARRQHPDAAAACAAESREAGARVVLVGPVEEGDDLEQDLVVGPPTGIPAIEPIDISRNNPRGFQRLTSRPPALPVRSLDDDSWRAAAADWENRLGADGFELVVVADDDRSNGQVQRGPVVVAPKALHSHAAVLEHPTLHMDVREHARRLLQWTANGLPTWTVDLPDVAGELLGPELTDALLGHTVEDFSTPDTRERISVRQRRAALRGHRHGARWRQLAAPLGLRVPPEMSVSVLLATNRPEWLEHAIDSVAQQDWPNVELVLALHGDAFDNGDVANVEGRAGVPVTTIRAKSDVILGELLNLATEAASGRLIAKMDDDDWYAPEHLTDLVLAAEYAGAELVGKAAEFAHLAELDITIRRFTVGAESNSRTLGGGALLVQRAALDGVGGWRRVPRSVDKFLIEDVAAAGGRIYRTHGLGFVLNRHGLGHTWGSDVDYFLRQSVGQRRGLALDWAGIEDEA